MAPVTLKLTAPLPEPPDVVRVTEELMAMLLVVLEIESVDWRCLGAVKVKVFVSEVAAANEPCAAFVATTVQVVADREVRVVAPLRLESVQAELAGERAKVVAPVPEPPDVVKVTEVPAGLVVVALEIVSVA